jgi:hypothetical protein
LEINLAGLESDAAGERRPPTQAGHQQKIAPGFENAGCARRLFLNSPGVQAGKRRRKRGWRVVLDSEFRKGKWKACALAREVGRRV